MELKSKLLCRLNKTMQHKDFLIAQSLNSTPNLEQTLSMPPTENSIIVVCSNLSSGNNITTQSVKHRQKIGIIGSETNN